MNKPKMYYLPLNIFWVMKSLCNTFKIRWFIKSFGIMKVAFLLKTLQLTKKETSKFGATQWITITLTLWMLCNTFKIRWFIKIFGIMKVAFLLKTLQLTKQETSKFGATQWITITLMSQSNIDTWKVWWEDYLLWMNKQKNVLTFFEHFST